MVESGAQSITNEIDHYQPSAVVESGAQSITNENRSLRTFRGGRIRGWKRRFHGPAKKGARLSHRLVIDYDESIIDEAPILGPLKRRHSTPMRAASGAVEETRRPKKIKINRPHHHPIEIQSMEVDRAGKTSINTRYNWVSTKCP